MVETSWERELGVLQWRKMQDVLELEGAGVGEESRESRNRGDKSKENWTVLDCCFDLLSNLGDKKTSLVLYCPNIIN